MKSSFKLFLFLITTATFAACVTSESDMLRQARSIQNDMMTEVGLLDSTMTAKLVTLNNERSEMALDSTLNTDSVKMQTFMQSKERIDNISNLQSSLTDWKINLKMLPTEGDMNKGVDNPFGEKAKDQEILMEIKKSQDAFSALKMKADAAMK